jgi:predicted naringenin-chalcone synthase
MSFAILGLGTAQPATSLDQVEAVAIARILCCPTEDEAESALSLYRQTGITKRHIAIPPEAVRDVLEGTRESGSIFVPRVKGARDPGPTTGQRMQHFAQQAVPLALGASESALHRAGSTAEDVTHLVLVSCTGFSAPGVDIQLIKRLGLAPTVQRTQVGFMGCHGAMNGLRVAQALTDADPAAHVLLCAVELCSHHYHYGWDPKKLVANALFADGAAAVVGDADGPADAWRVTATGSCVFPDSEYAMTWTIGDYGFDMTLSTRVPALITENLGPWLASWLLRHGLTIDQVGSWAVHPGGPRILTAVEEALGLDEKATTDSRAVLAECGNMSSPTILFVLQRLQRRDAPRPCVALAFGPGLTAEVALIR